MVISESVYRVPPLLPLPRAVSEVQQNTGVSSEFLQGVTLCVSSLLRLTGLLRYLPAAGDQTLALNIVLYMHYTEEADGHRGRGGTIPVNYELKVHIKMFLDISYVKYIQMSCNFNPISSSSFVLYVYHPGRFESNNVTLCLEYYYAESCLSEPEAGPGLRIDHHVYVEMCV